MIFSLAFIFLIVIIILIRKIRRSEEFQDKNSDYNMKKQLKTIKYSTVFIISYIVIVLPLAWIYSFKI
jgi:glucose uptake protein GlcU